MGLIIARVEYGLLTAHLIMARDTFRPMARGDTGLLKAHNFIGPNGPEIYFGMLTGNYGLYWPVNFLAQRWPNLGFSLLKAHGILWPSWLELYSAC